MPKKRKNSKSSPSNKPSRVSKNRSVNTWKVQELILTNTDIEWEKWGQMDPYFGVITSEKFRSENMTLEALDEFFDSGEGHVDHVLQTIHRVLDGDFTPRRVLDFGCGTGRLVVPFARRFEEVVGLDIASSMLKEAASNCDDHNVHNVSLLKSDDALSALEGGAGFDLIHSVVVFQHIPVERGLSIFSGLLKHLNKGGVGALHFTYAKAMFEENQGIPPKIFWIRALWRSILRMRRRVLAEIKCKLPRLLGGASECEPQDPGMQMNSYHLSQLMFILQQAGVERTYVEFSDHGGEYGVFLYFQKPE